MTDEAKALVERLRGDWPEILVEKHWMMDSDAIDKQREEAADLIETQAREIERLKNMLKPQWFYHGEDQSSDQCRFSPYEVIDEDFFGWGERKKEGPHLVHISTAMPGPDIWAVVRVLTEEEMDARDDDEPWLIEEYDTEEEARAALAGDSHDQ